jgi:hypothetical protein
MLAGLTHGCLLSVEQVYPDGGFGYHLKPFRAAVEAGTATLMPYYGLPAGLTLPDGVAGPADRGWVRPVRRREQSRAGPLRLFELYDVKPRQRAAADLHETSGVMQSAEVDGRESHRVGKR